MTTGGLLVAVSLAYLAAEQALAAFLTGFAAMVAMMVLTALVMHAQRGRVKGFFLLCIELTVEGLGGVGTVVHFCITLGAHFTHLVDALGWSAWQMRHGRRGQGRSPGFMASV